MSGCESSGIHGKPGCNASQICNRALHRYIYAVRWATSQVPDNRNLDFAPALRAVLAAIVDRGRHTAAARRCGWPLAWECFGELYLGAAHGMIGTQCGQLQMYPVRHGIPLQAF
jgi:hypothetical protein